VDRARGEKARGEKETGIVACNVNDEPRARKKEKKAEERERRRASCPS